MKFRNPGGSNSNLTAVFIGRINILISFYIEECMYSDELA